MNPRTRGILDRYLDQVPIDKIIEEFSVSRIQILRYARVAGLPKRPKGFDPKVRSRALELYELGVPLKIIRHKLGVSEAYISKAAATAGLKLRRKHHKGKK